MKELKKYEKACNDLKDVFLKSLYPDHPEYYDDAYWIGGQEGEILAWGDWFVDMNNIANYFIYNLTSDDFFEWYDRWIEEEPRLKMQAFKYFRGFKHNKKDNEHL